MLNNTTIKHLGNGDDPIEVFPPEIFFKGKQDIAVTIFEFCLTFLSLFSNVDIEPNQNYEVTVTIRNITKNMRRIMFTQPSNSRFHCEYENIGSVAAGLSVKMSMQFETTETGDFHDMIEILTEGYT